MKLRVAIFAALAMLGLTTPAFAADCSGGGILGMLIGGTPPNCAYATVTPNGGLATSADGITDGVNVAASAVAAGVLTNTPFLTIGYSAVEVNISAFTATSITPQASYDGGSTYTTVQCVNVSSPTGGNTASIPSTGVYECPTGDHFQLTQVGAGATTAKITLKRWSSNVGRASTVSGNSASGAADSGSPIKVGGVYSTAPVAFTTGQRGNAWIDQFGDLGFSPQCGGCVFETADSGNVANAAATATLAAAAGKTTFITGLTVTAGGATAGLCVTGTITGTISTTIHFTYCTPTGVTAAGPILAFPIVPAIPASAANTTIAVSLPALGAGNTNATVSATGFQQ